MPDESHAASPPNQRSASLALLRSWAGVASLVLSLAALAIAFQGLREVDLAIVRLFEHDDRAWVNHLGDMGHALGSGVLLVVISAGLLAVGWLRQRPTLLKAGWQTLVAHAVAAIFVQAGKHLIGRPRPWFVLAGDVPDGAQGPTMWPGLDSFPSGHSTASFAIAAVVARWFPRYRWLYYGLAAFISTTRVIRGSHFPTDVAIGACLGLLIGWLISAPLRDWRFSIDKGIRAMTPWVVAIFGLVWVAANRSSGTEWYALVHGTGLAICGLAVGCRVYGQFALMSQAARSAWLTGGNSLACAGLAMVTGAPVVVAAAVPAILAYLFDINRETTPSSHPSSDRPVPTPRLVLVEIGIMAGLGAVILVVEAAKGILTLL